MSRDERQARLLAAAGRIRSAVPVASDDALTGPDPETGERWDRRQVLAHVAEMLAYASEAAPVRRGDVLGSGTCGTGCILELSLVHGAEKYPYLQPGDEVELEVSGLGVLANRVVAGAAAAFRPDADRVRPRLGQ